MNERKREKTGIELPNQENIRKLRVKESYKNLWILEGDTKEIEMRWKWIPQKDKEIIWNQNLLQKLTPGLSLQ